MLGRDHSPDHRQLRIPSVPRADADDAPVDSNDRRSLAVAGLFAGIGGLERGLKQAHHETLLLCENDTAARAVLAAHFGHVADHPEDVTKLVKLPDETKLVAAGFPCQDLSQAGKTAGIAGARSGLVGEVFRLLGLKEDGTVTKPEKRPEFVLLENVPFMLQLARGEALNVIVSALERLDYKWAYRVIDARAFGLPQRRERVFLVASLNEDPRDILLAKDAGEPEKTRDLWPKDVACGFYWTEGTRGLGWGIDCIPTLKGGSTIGIPSPPAIVLPNGRIVVPHIQDAERLQGFPEGYTTAAETVGRRTSRWKLVGNAVNVRVSKWIGQQFAKPGHYSAARTKESEVRPHAAWPRAAFNVGDGRRVEVDVSSWPVRRKLLPLAEFLRFSNQPLSQKATLGFLKRARASSLRFQPGFLDAVQAHLDWVATQEPRTRRPRARRSAAA